MLKYHAKQSAMALGPGKRADELAGRGHTFTAQDKLAEVKREIGLRYGVYTKYVAAGLLTRAEANRRIAIMEAIADDYRKLAAEEASVAAGYIEWKDEQDALQQTAD